MLTGAANNYQYPYAIGILRREDKLVGNGGNHNNSGFRFWGAKAYKDTACRKVIAMGIDSCFKCPFPDCTGKDIDID